MNIEIKEDGKFLQLISDKYDYFEVIKSEHAIFAGYDILTIKGVIKPKKQPIKDLGKAVNWVYKHSIANAINGFIIATDRHPSHTNVSLEDIKDIVIDRDNIPDWWPEELME